ncbi:hypothetical protein ACIOYT_32315 [Streptomyces halstedii]|uniref:hypothetical protein n=1 Tax=Streptomyces halstedii TaxID=1944 RepID=UPI003817AB91
MKWKDAFSAAMKELEAIRALLAPVARLEDKTVGLTALHAEVTQSRLKILEAVQIGVTGLREENREVRRRQDRMISDLSETRSELRQLLDLADILRPLAELQRPADEPHAGAPTPVEPAATEPSLEHGHEPAASATAPPTSSDTESQGGTMEDSDRQAQPEPEGPDDALKQAIEAVYQGNGTPATPSSTAPAATGQGQDPRVAHGVLLLKAAGVASVDLVAHRDTWEWLTALAVDHDHFRTPPSVEDVKEGRVQTVLSGRSLIGLLIKLWDTRHTATPLEADWALATTAYNRIAADLTGVDGEGQTIRIVLDDGLPHTDND